MRTFLIGFALSIALASCSLLDTNPGPAASAPAAGSGTVSTNMKVDTAIGGTLYRTLCARCHGDSGQGTTVAPKNIQGMAGIAAVVRGGTGIMPAFAQLSDSDIVSIEKYLAQFTPAGFDTMSGAAIYKLYCATCHGDSAQGITGRGLGIQGDTANVTHFVRNGGTTMPKYPQITDAQLTKIKQFLLTFALPTDGAGLYKLYCASCHGAAGAGVAGSGPAIQQDTNNLRTYIHNGGRLMPAIKSINDAQITLIIDCINRMALPTDGAGLYMRYCASCHATNALGDSVQYSGVAGGTGPVWQAISSGYTPRADDHGSTLPKMAAIPALNQAQSNLISQWLQGVTFEHTGRNVWNINCLCCHGTNKLRGDGGQAGFQRTVQQGKESMPASTWLSQTDVDSLYYYVTH